MKYRFIDSASGPGEYGSELSDLMKKTESAFGILILQGGPRGPGFSIQAVDKYVAEVQSKMPQLLRLLASEIEKQNNLAAQQ